MSLPILIPMLHSQFPTMLQCPGTSWGFSIVGGAEPGSNRSPEPVHVLFVVPESPAAKVRILMVVMVMVVTVMVRMNLFMSSLLYRRVLPLR